MGPSADSSARQAASLWIRKTPLPLTALATAISVAPHGLVPGGKTIALQWFSCCDAHNGRHSTCFDGWPLPVR
jgi:hypothetical protein